MTKLRGKEKEACLFSCNRKSCHQLSKNLDPPFLVPRNAFLMIIILWIDRAYVSRIMVTLDDTFVISGLSKVLVLMGENQSLGLWCQYLLNAYYTVGLWPRQSFLAPPQVSHTAVSEASFLLVIEWEGLYLISTLIFVFETILLTDLAFSWLGVLDLVLNWPIQACLLSNHHTYHCIILMYM